MLDTIIELEKDCISLPLYHRSSLSLKSGTEVSFCLIPSKSPDLSVEMSEIIVSPIDFKYWDCSVRISAMFREMPGLVSKLMRILKQEKLNVLICESCSIQNRTRHFVEIIAETSKCTKKSSTDSVEPEYIEYLRRRLVSMFSKNEILIRDDEHTLKVRKLKGLYAARRRFNEGSKDTILGKTRIMNGQILLTKDLIDSLQANGLTKYQVISDTKDRMLSVFFHKKEESFTYVRISHIHEIGVLSLITSQLAKVFSIISCLCRLQSEGKNDFEALLYSKEYNKKSDENKRREIINNLLAIQDFKALNIELSYPENVGQQKIKKQKPKIVKNLNFKELSNAAAVDSKLLNTPTAKILNFRIRGYQEELSTLTSYEERREISEHLRLLATLADEEQEDIIDPKVFVSYEFLQKRLFNEAENYLKHKDCIVSSGADPNNNPVFREVIKERIKGAQCFLGIWTKSKSEMSAWLFWELGIAQAYNLPFRLMCHKDLPPGIMTQINPEKNHIIFDDFTFKEKLPKAVEFLLNDYKIAKLNQRKE